MTIDERLRLSIHSKLTDLIGTDEADAIINHLMPVPWRDVATKDDIQLVRNEMSVTRAEMRTEMAEMRTELKGDIAELRTELKADIAELRTELKADIAALRTELKADIAELRTELNGEMAALRVEMRDLMVGQTRWMLGYVTALSAVMLTIARFVF